MRIIIHLKLFHANTVNLMGTYKTFGVLLKLFVAQSRPVALYTASESCFVVISANTKASEIHQLQERNKGISSARTYFQKLCHWI